MQYAGHLKIGEKIIRVLARPNTAGGYIALKLRRGGRDGRELTDESAYLSTNPGTLARLERGEVIRI